MNSYASIATAAAMEKKQKKIIAIQYFLREMNDLKTCMSILTSAPYCLKFINDPEEKYVLIQKTDLSDTSEIMVQECTGIILDIKNNYEIVHWSGEYNYNGFHVYNNEYDESGNIKNSSLISVKGPDSTNQSINLNSINENDIYIKKYIENTAIKIYFDNYSLKWKIATNGVIDALDPKFLENHYSFGKQFENLVLKSYNTMNQFFQEHDKQYFYTYGLVLGDINTVFETKKYYFLINKINKETLEYQDYTQQEKMNIPKEKLIEFISNIDQENPNEKYILTYFCNGHCLNYNIFSDKFKIYREIVWKCKSTTAYDRISELYFYSVCNSDYNRLIDYASLTDEYLVYCSEIQEKFENLINTISHAYYKKFIIHKKDYNVPQKLRPFVYSIHTDYIKRKTESNGGKIITTKKDIQNVFYNMQFHIVLNAIKC